MKFSSALIGAGTALSTQAVLAAAASSGAKPLTTCPNSDKMCFSVLVPPSSASAGKGDIFFQIQAPSSYEWTALGQGPEMQGSNIFMVYTDSAGTNITLSARAGTGEVEPEHDASVQVELLEGSGIANGLMTANVRCANCASWSGGTMDFTDAESNWIWAYKSGSGAGTDDVNANLPIHDEMGSLEFDLTKAVGGSSSVNPFVTTNGAAAAPVAANATSSGASSSSSGTDGNSIMTATAAHGIIMALTMVVIFPSGAVMRRLAPRVSIWAHAAVQSVALVATIVAAGIGGWVAMKNEETGSAHVLLGIAVTVLMALQPVWGLLQHRFFKNNQARGPFGHVHRIVGGIAILLGIINGGLGLKLADTLGTPGANAYILMAAVFGSIFGITYVAMALSDRVTPPPQKRRRHRHRSFKQMADATVWTNPVFGAQRQGQRNESA